MSDNAAELTAILQQIDAARQSFTQTLASLSDAQMTVPMQDGSSVKDLLAHVAFWDRRFIHALQPEPPNAFRLVPPEIADIPYREDMRWAEVVNARIRQLNAQRSLADIRRDFEQTGSRLDLLLRELTAHDVFDENGLSAVIGMSFEEFMRGIYEHYEAHAGDLRRL